MSGSTRDSAAARLVAQVGGRLRARRLALGLTQRGLAEAAGISVRYIAQAEQGAANLSLGKLADLAAALGIEVAALVSEGPRGAIDALLAPRSADELATVAAWLRGRFGGDAPRMVALLGVRGAGKSSVGRRLAARLGRPFIELDARIADRAELSLAELFALHGEPYYRRLEFEALGAIIEAGADAVIATGGSIVTHPENFARLRAAAVCVWLQARPEDHWDRVIQQGDRRPMRDHPHALAELRALLAARAPLYQQADLVVETAHRSLPETVEAVAQALASRGGSG